MKNSEPKPNQVRRYFVIDVESIGLHGEGYAVGFVLVDTEGNRLDQGMFATRPYFARGDSEGHKWVKENAPELRVTHDSPWQMRAAFWRKWLEHKTPETVMAAECAWPVEARFLTQCVDDHPMERAWTGPYPLHEVATLMLSHGLDPLLEMKRLPEELPKHNPLCDALQTARLLLEYSPASLIQSHSAHSVGPSVDSPASP